MRQTVTIAVLVIALAVGLYFLWPDSSDEPLPVVEIPPAEAVEPRVDGEQPETPAAQADAGTTAEEADLPAPVTSLEADDYLRERYEGSNELLNEFLAHDQIIEKITAATDAVWRDQNPKPSLNFLTPEGKLGVTRRDGKWYLSADNYQRYAPFVNALDAIDDDRLADTYLVLAPLLRSAHEALGNPHATWDELLLGVLDKLVAMEVPTEAPELASTGKYYIFTDPDLEKLSPSHKALIRMGPDQASRFQKKLKGFRARLNLTQ